MDVEETVERRRLKWMGLAFIIAVFVAMVILAVVVVVMTKLKVNSIDGAILGAIDNEAACSSDPTKVR